MHYIIVFLFIISCGGLGSDDYPTPPPPGIPPPSNGGPDIATFQKDVRPVLQANCALSGCHAGAGFVQNAENFKNSNAPKRIINGSMPPSYSPKFGQWGIKEKETVLDWYDDNM